MSNDQIAVVATSIFNFQAQITDYIRMGYSVVNDSVKIVVVQSFDERSPIINQPVITERHFCIMEK